MSADSVWSRARWNHDVRGPATAAAPERLTAFTTASGTPVGPLYTSEDLADIDEERDIGRPGAFPYTRGIYADGHGTASWIMQASAGVGTPEATNRRLRALLAAGATGLGVVFDRPTLMGLDPDAPSARDVGVHGVSVASLADLEQLFADIPIGTIPVSLGVNATAPMIWAMYLALADGRGVPRTTLAGATENDVLSASVADIDRPHPLALSMRLATDLLRFTSVETPAWDAVVLGGWRMREAGATAAQELAFAIRAGIEYLERGVAAGMDIDTCASRMSLSIGVSGDVFEEIATCRAARRLWARAMRDRCGARRETSWRLRIRAVTAAGAAAADDIYNDVVRGALQALAAVAGGANLLDVRPGTDADHARWTETATLALRTQQILLHESGLAGVPDPFGGAWFVERLTSDLDADACRYITAIDRMGGMVEAVEREFPQREIADAARRRSDAAEIGLARAAGASEQTRADRDGLLGGSPPRAAETHAHSSTHGRRLDAMRALRQRRDEARVARGLAALRDAASGHANTMRPLVECARVYATLGEMSQAIREAAGEREGTGRALE